jgi:uncharacterized membrane protein YbaN (DUF454 family)
MNTNANESDDGEQQPIPQASFAKRMLMAGLGIFFVAIAAVGVFLPGIPTVGPLLLASVFLTKSSPALERRLIRNRFFASYLHYLDGSKELSPQAKRASIGLMWLSISISYSVLYFTGKGPIWLLVILVVAGLVGTVFIWRFGRKNNGKVPKANTVGSGG